METRQPVLGYATAWQVVVCSVAPGRVCKVRVWRAARIIGWRGQGCGSLAAVAAGGRCSCCACRDHNSSTCAVRAHPHGSRQQEAQHDVQVLSEVCVCMCVFCFCEGVKHLKKAVHPIFFEFAGSRECAQAGSVPARLSLLAVSYRRAAATTVVHVSTGGAMCWTQAAGGPACCHCGRRRVVRLKSCSHVVPF